MVDCGSTTSISATRRRKYSCSASADTSDQHQQARRRAATRSLVSFRLRTAGRALRAAGSSLGILRAAQCGIPSGRPGVLMRQDSAAHGPRAAPARCPGARRARSKRLRPPARPACPARHAPVRRARSPSRRNARAAGPYIMSSASAPSRSTLGATGMAPPCRLLEVALITMSKAVCRSHRPARRRRRTLMRDGVSGMRVDQRIGFRRCAIGDHELGRSLLDQRAEHAGRRAAGADQQHAAASKRDACIAGDVAHEPDAVGVVAAPAVAVEAQRVHAPASAARCAASARQAAQPAS